MKLTKNINRKHPTLIKLTQNIDNNNSILIKSTKNINSRIYNSNLPIDKNWNHVGFGPYEIELSVKLLLEKN